jgi:D-aminopeptidase
MTNVQIERLDPRAELIKGFHKHLKLCHSTYRRLDSCWYTASVAF